MSKPKNFDEMMAKWKAQGERELKNFKLKPAEKSLIALMDNAQKEKKPYQDRIREMEAAIEQIEKQRETWREELEERMGEKRYRIYKRLEIQKAMQVFNSLAPLVALTAVVATITNVAREANQKPKRKKNGK